MSFWIVPLVSILVFPGNVTSIDRIKSLAEKAQENTKRLRNHLKQKNPQDVEKISKLNFLAENIFSKENAWKKRYDKIIITAGIANTETKEKVEEMAKSLLKKKGILVCPYVSGPLVIYKKNKKLERKETKEQYVFVPLLEGVEK